MKTNAPRLMTGALCLLMLTAALAAQARADFDRNRWEFVAGVRLDAPPVDKGLVQVFLPDEVLDKAQPSLADIRITDGAGKELPRVIERGGRGTAGQHVEINARLLNAAYVPGKSSSVTADFGRKVAKDHVKVSTRGNDFRRVVMLESSDDGTTWQRVREGALIFRVARAGADFEQDVVRFPDNDQRYLRVTVFSSEGDEGQIEILSVTSDTHLASGEKPVLTRPVNIAETNTTQKQDDRQTWIEFNIRYRHLPLDELKLEFSDENFFRRVRLEGRDALKRAVRRPREDADMKEETEDVPWEPLRSGVLYRYTAGGAHDEKLTIRLDGTGRRYLRLIIENEANPPLDFRGAELTRFQDFVLFPPEGGTRWQLFLGNPRAKTPEYDLPHYVARLRTEGVVDAMLEPMAENPVFTGSEGAKPWLEAHPGVLWGVLILVIVALGLIILRQARTLKDNAPAE